MSERHACRLAGHGRTTQRYQPTQGADEDRLTQANVAFASKYGRLGYRRITALLKVAGWQVGKDLDGDGVASLFEGGSLPCLPTVFITSRSNS